MNSFSSFGTLGCLASSQCCAQHPAVKNPTEVIPIQIDWSEESWAGWTLQSVVHTITLDTGVALSGDPNDLVIAQDTSSVNMEKVYEAARATIVMVKKGIAGIHYRVTATTTWRSCDGFIRTSQFCVIVVCSAC